MNKEYLIEEVVKVLDTKLQAQAAVESILSGVTEALKVGDSVTLTAFGTFKVVQRKARQGRNPSTGETIQIPAQKVVKFTAGKKLLDSIQ